MSRVEGVDPASAAVTADDAAVLELLCKLADLSGGDGGLTNVRLPAGYIAAFRRVLSSLRSPSPKGSERTPLTEDALKKLKARVHAAVSRVEDAAGRGASDKKCDDAYTAFTVALDELVAALRSDRPDPSPNTGEQK